MKNGFLALVGAIMIFMLPSCEMNDNDGKTRIIQDSLVNVLPTWQALKIKVEDHTVMNIIVGDATFYKASPDEKNKKAEEVGRMVERIYGKDNMLQKGNLIVTSDIRNESENPKDGIQIPIDFSALKKAVYPK